AGHADDGAGARRAHDQAPHHEAGRALGHEQARRVRSPARPERLHRRLGWTPARSTARSQRRGSREMSAAPQKTSLLQRDLNPRLPKPALKVPGKDATGSQQKRKQKQSQKQKGKQIVGLKIGSSQIAAAVVANNGSPRLVSATREALQPGIVSGGELREPE